MPKDAVEYFRGGAGEEISAKRNREAFREVYLNPNGAVRRVTDRVCRWRDPEMVLRWMASAYLEAERSFRRIQGYRDLWVLSTVLGRACSTSKVDLNTKAA